MEGSLGYILSRIKEGDLQPRDAAVLHCSWGGEDEKVEERRTKGRPPSICGGNHNSAGWRGWNLPQRARPPTKRQASFLATFSRDPRSICIYLDLHSLYNSWPGVFLMAMDTDAGPNPEILFRPAKKRKFLRRRPDPATEDAQNEAPAAVNQANEHASSMSQSRPNTEEAPQLTDVMRLRRPHRARKGGIEFSTTPRPAIDSGSQSAVSTPAEDLEDEKIQAMCDRFTGHTGQTVDVDKHMMAYIETEMAKRYNRSASTEAGNSEIAATNEARDGQTPAGLPQREPASLGKLHEIDLGQETKLENIARTEAATRRLAGNEDQVMPGDEDDMSKVATPAAGKSGKPWRHRKRRNSEDIERDRLVEEVLRESKLDVYDEPDEDLPADDQAADDRIAEQFRRDFIDAIQSRRRVARTKNPKATNKQEAPRGPKLGGSRSARAAMREMQEKSGQK